MNPPSKLAALIAKEEGYGIPGAIPTTHNNPGDLRHSPHSFHSGDPNAIGEIDTQEHGWEDLERQLELFASRGLTLQQAIYEFAPPSENDSAGYLKYVCTGLGCSPSISVTEALKIPWTPPTDPQPISTSGTSSGSSSGSTSGTWWARFKSYLGASPQPQAVSHIPGAVSASSVAVSVPTFSPVSKSEVQVSTPNPVLVAAAPSLIAALQAVQTFISNLGTDPAQVAIKFPGALQVLLGSIEMQLPGLASSEIGAVQTAANARIAAWIASLQAQTKTS